MIMLNSTGTSPMSLTARVFLSSVPHTKVLSLSPTGTCFSQNTKVIVYLRISTQTAQMC